jgi:hypothetical protein
MPAAGILGGEASWSGKLAGPRGAIGITFQRNGSNDFLESSLNRFAQYN